MDSAASLMNSHEWAQLGELGGCQDFKYLFQSVYDTKLYMASHNLENKVLWAIFYETLMSFWSVSFSPH